MYSLRQCIRQFFPALFAVLAVLSIASCGGGGGSSTITPTPPTADFSLSVTPSSLSLSRGGSSQAAVSVTAINGFDSSVGVTVSASSTNVTVLPATFTILPGGQQIVTVSAAAGSRPGAVTLTVSAKSGTLSHSSTIALAVQEIVTSAYVPGRTRYVRTDAFYDPDALLNSDQVLTVFDSVNNLFFVTDASLGHVSVFDAATQTLLTTISVPGAYGIDESLDHSTVWVATQIGDVYAIDPVALTVTQRYPAFTIGPSGYPSYEVRALADGRLALLGNQGGNPAVDGYGSIAIWSPTSNSFQEYGNPFVSSGQNTIVPIDCGTLVNIGNFGLTGDRKTVVLVSADTDGAVCLLNPDDGGFRVAAGARIGLSPQVLSPAGSGTILVVNGDTVDVFDSTSAVLTSSFMLPWGGGWDYNYTLSVDGGTLYAVEQIAGYGLVYDWKTQTNKGWFPAYHISDGLDQILPQAEDGTGVIAGPIGHGFALIDASKPQSGSPPDCTNTWAHPAAGPLTARTPLALDGSCGNPAPVVSSGYVGAQAAVQFGLGGLTTPASTIPGPADLALANAAGVLVLEPEGFSYGPHIVLATPNAATTDSGAFGAFFGYGFGTFVIGNASMDPALKVTVGGDVATNLQFIPDVNATTWDPFPMQEILYEIPPGSAGSAADVMVSNSMGTTTISQALQIYPSALYPLPGVSTSRLPAQSVTLEGQAAGTAPDPLNGTGLAQGVYDTKRDVYYFSGPNQIQVFSLTQKAWLTPFSVPLPSLTAVPRLWGIAISPDGSTLAVADTNNNVIHVLDPDIPSSIAPHAAGCSPAGLAVSNARTVFYACRIGGPAYSLNLGTGRTTAYLPNVTFLTGEFARAILSGDGKRGYIDYGGTLITADIASGAAVVEAGTGTADDELALSSNGTTLTASEFLYDADWNPKAFLAPSELENEYQPYVYGEKLSPDGVFLFATSTASADVFDGRLGNLLTRVALPYVVSDTFDALVVDGKDNVLLVITGQYANAVLVLDLSAMPEPLPLTYPGAEVQSKPFASTMRIGRSSALPAVTDSKASRNSASPVPVSRMRHSTHAPALGSSMKAAH